MTEGPYGIKLNPPTVNDFSPPELAVEVNFWWDENGPVESYTFDGDSYPYISPEPASRYIMHTTYIQEPVHFYAILDPKQAEEELKHPRVVTPAGVGIVQYLWDFGDGTTGDGPFATHEYKVLEPGIEVKLTVVDTRGLTWSAAKPMNLAAHAYGYISRRIVPL
jgi:hypothetical protein